MIRYATTLESLQTTIDAADKHWRGLAAQKTAALRLAGKYDDSSPIWSRVKKIYMDLQGEAKCAYCERKLESADRGQGEQGVDHFRPKSSVKAWPAAGLTVSGIPFADPPGDHGYFLLAFHLFNYAAACIPCNSAIKSNYFPIAGTYDTGSDDPAKLRGEKHYLIYPIGNVDENPENIIRFNGLSPCPVVKSGHKKNRALVTIEFFKLADQNIRKNLFRERATLIMALYPQLVNETHSSSETIRAKATRVIMAFTSDKAPHANCMRSYKRLFESAPDEAEKFYLEAEDFVLSGS